MSIGIAIGMHLGRGGTGAEAPAYAIADLKAETDLEFLFWGPDIVASDGAALAQLDDGSGNARHALQADGAKQGLYRATGLNGHPCVEFDATNDCFVIPSFAFGSSQATIYAVALCPSGSDRVLVEASAAYSSNANSFILYRASTNKVAAGARFATATPTERSTATLVNTTAFIATGRYDSSSRRHFAVSMVNGLFDGTWTSMSAAVTSATNFGTHAINIGARNNGASLPLGGKIAALAIFSGAHNAAKRKQIETLLADTFTIAAYQAPLGQIVCDGDSLTEGETNVHANNMPQQLRALMTDAARYDWFECGVAGQVVSNMNTDAATQVDRWYSDGLQNLALLNGGTNDLCTVGGEQTAATVISRLSTYLTARRAAGWETAYATILPRSDAGQPPVDFDTKRDTVNTAVRTGGSLASLVDAVADIAANTDIGENGDSDNTTYYNADKVHLNQTGYGVWAAVADPALAGIGYT